MPAQNPQDFFNVYDSRPWTQSYAPGVSWELSEIPYRTIGELISQTSRRFAEQPAYTTCLDNGLSGTLTYTEIDTLSNHFAQFLLGDLGLQKGDRVAVQLPNCLAYPIVAHGILRAGLVLVNTNPLYTEREMEHQFCDSESKVLVIIDMFADKLTQVIPKTKINTVVQVSVADLFPYLKRQLIKTVLKIKKRIPEIKVHTRSHTKEPAQ